MPPTGPAIGTLVDGRFRVEAFAGAGGMGSVFRAIDTNTNDLVALKVIDPGGGADTRRFQREAEVLSSLNHPGIVKHVGHGKAGGLEYLAMEWVEGRDLAALISRKAIPVGQVVHLARGVCSALQHAHEKGVIHRDLKPSNILLEGGNPEKPKLADFGIARVDDATVTLTKTGALLGTVGYMAPEQARGDRHVGPTADIFAFGAVLYEALAGTPVHRAENLVALLTKILFEPIPPVSSLRSGVPAWLDELIASMLNKRAADRPDDISVVWEAVTRAADRSASLPDRGGAPAVSKQEQRVVSIIMLTAPSADTTLADATISGETADEDFSRMRGALANSGCDVDVLADGTWTASLEGAGRATDQAKSAVLAALRLHHVRPGSRIVVATGRGQSGHAVPMGEVIDRAASLLRSTRRSGATTAELRLDGTTAGLLGLESRVFVGERALEDLSAAIERQTVRTLLGHPSMFVGRNRELESLTALYDECVDESCPRGVLVLAPAGAGKTRLRHELVRTLERADPAPDVFLCTGEMMGGAAAHALIGTAVRRKIGIQEDTAPDDKRGLMATFLEESFTEEEGREHTPFLSELAGIPFPSGVSEALDRARRDPALMQESLRSAWLRLLASRAEVLPVAIVVEDLHWADTASVRWIASAVESLEACPLFVLCLSRPEAEEQLLAPLLEAGLEKLDLPGIRRKPAEKLVRHALGAAAAPATVERIVALADGNALYLEELIRAVAEGRGDALPDTISVMVQSWLEALSGDARRVLRAASLFGQTFWERGVLALLGEDVPRPVHEELDELVRREVLRRDRNSRYAGQQQFVFRHALVRDAAYGMLTTADRHEAHARAARWLLDVGESQWVVIAEHYSRSAAPRETLSWLEGLADEVHHLRWAPQLDSVRQLTLPSLDRWAAGHQRARSRMVLGGMYSSSHRFAEADELVAEAEQLSSDDPALLAQAQLLRGESLFRRGDFAAARDALEKLQRKDIDEAGALRLEVTLALPLAAAGEVDRALEHLNRAEALAPREDLATRTEIAKTRGIALYFAERYEACLDAFERHLALAEAAGLTYEVALGLHNKGGVLVMLDRGPAALEAMRASLALARAHGFARLAVHDRMYIAGLDGDRAMDRAVSELRELIASADESDYGWGSMDGRWMLSRVLLGGNQLAEAKLVLEELLPHAERLGNSSVADYAKRTLGKLRNK